MVYNYTTIHIIQHTNAKKLLIYSKTRGAKLIRNNCIYVLPFSPPVLQIDADGAACEASTALGLSSCSRNIEFVRAQDWESAIKDSYQPVQIAPFLWIVPTWAKAPDPNAINLILEPGLAFGTGDHPTTRLCLRWLQNLDLEGLRIMDYGTGSGVLAVGAVLMGAILAVGKIIIICFI